MNEYSADTVLWSERQAELLRRVAAGEAAAQEPYSGYPKSCLPSERAER